jgi:hypothetical protein
MTDSSRGDFSFVNDTHTREMLQDAFTAVESVPGGWDSLLSQPPHGCMYSVPEKGSPLERINTALQATETGAKHSGFSYAWTMGMMQRIARTTWDQWVTLFKASQQLKN